jgi:invasion protein IalB
MIANLVTNKFFLIGIIILVVCGIAIHFTITNQSSDFVHSDKVQEPVSIVKGWQKRCLANDNQNCEIFQNIYIEQNGASFKLSEISVGKKNNDLFFVLATPNGIDKSKGYGVQVDNGPILEIPIQKCETFQCYSLSKIASDFLNAMKTGTHFNAYFIDGADKTVKIEFTLQGFTKSINNL